MTIVETTSAGALEAAIRARIAIDAQAREVVQQLDGKLIQLTIDGKDLFVLFQDSGARVSTHTDETPNLALSGSVIEIGKTLLTDQMGKVTVDGDSDLLDLLRMIFRPSLTTSDFAEKAMATAEYGVAAARSAFEGLASEFTTNKTDHAKLDEIAAQVQRIEGNLSDLERRIKMLEER